MSRVAKKAVVLPKGVECAVKDNSITVKGPKGTLKQAVLPGTGVKVENGEIHFTTDDENGSTKMAGTTRALVYNMVHGVSQGYERKLELVGVGYRATMAGKDLNLTLGFSHPIIFKAPEGITLAAPSQTEVVIQGSDKQSVGEVAAKIRAFRPPEPYKGKGVRYAGEKITLKEAKKA